MSVFEEIFHPEAADARRAREIEKTLPIPAPPAGALPLIAADGSEIVIPALDASASEG